MIRGLIAALCLFITGLTLIELPAKAWWQSVPQISVGGASAAYVGPGDLTLTTTWTAWFGYRCFSAAYSGNVATIVDSATNLLITTITCSNGVLQTGSPTALATTCATACVSKVIFDQVGLNCVGAAACTLTTAGTSPAGGVSPVFTLNASPDGTKGCHTAAAGLKHTTANTSGAPVLTQAQAFSISTVFKNTAVQGAVTAIIGSQGANIIRDGFENTASPNNKKTIYTGSSFPGAVASINAFHAFAGVYNNASSAVAIDGTATTGLALGNTTGFSSSPVALNDTNQPGVFCEGGIANGAFTTTAVTGDIALISANQHDATNGWNF